MKLTLLLLLIISIISCQPGQQPVTTIEKIVEDNGLKSLEKAQLISFTFNVKRDTAMTSKRRWEWHPKSGEVVFITDSSSVRFNRNDTSTVELKKLNARFTNDEYWLLFPLHLKWDKGYLLSDSGMKNAPISGKNLHQFTVSYNKLDGFSPGDVYHIFLDNNNHIKEWSYHNAGAKEASLITTWEDYKDFNGVPIAQSHISKDGKFRLWFTDIKIE